MAIYKLVTLAKTDVDNYDYLQADNSVNSKQQKISLNSLFPSMATTGTSSESLYVSVTNKNQLNFKGIKAGDTGLLTVATDTNNIVLTVLEAGIDLDLCNNLNAGFLKAIDFSGSVTGECPVVSGGTGLSTVAKGSILYASAADTIAAATPASNGQILVHNSTTGVPAWASLGAGTNLTLDVSSAGAVTLNAAYTTATAILDMANYNIDLGTGYISADGSTNQGIRVTGANTYLGASGSYFNNAILNIGGGGIEFSDSSSITATDQTGGTAGKNVTIEGGGSAAAAAGGVYITGGTATGNGAGGSVIIQAGRDTSGTADGTIQLKTYTGGVATSALNVTAEGQDIQIPTGNLVITTANKTIVMSDRTDATQGTSATNSVTNNSASGIITLYGAALASQAEVEFTFTNSVIQSDSVILTGLECAATGRTAGANIQVYFHTKATGSCKIVVANTDDVSTDADDVFKIHYMVVNNSVT
jgi:hypothetical protein